jgi:hypothetical protein
MQYKLESYNDQLRYANALFNIIFQSYNISKFVKNSHENIIKLPNNYEKYFQIEAFKLFDI